MKKHIRIAAMVLGLIGFNTLNAQESGVAEVYGEGDQLFGINYSIGFPSGDFKDFIDETSWRGFNLEYDIFIIDNLSVGFSAGYRLFNQTDERATYTFENENVGVAISAKIWKYTHIVPLQATMRYYYAPSFDSWVHLFGGLALGTAYVNQETWVGLVTIQDDDWRFTFSPEAGIEIATGGLSNIQIGSQYQYILNGHNDEDPLTNWNLKVGFKKWIN